MGGPHQNNATSDRRSLAVESWILKNVEQHGYERYDDFHIDEIDEAWKSRESWIDGGLEAFRLAVKLRGRNRLDLSVVLAFSLLSDDEPRGINFRTREELRAQLNWSPPSLYMFQRGKEPWTETDILGGKVVVENATVKDLDATIFGTQLPAKRIYYMEFRQVNFDEYCRSVFVEG